MDGEMPVKTNCRECQEDINQLTRLYYACIISENDYGIECGSFNNFIEYFTGRWSSGVLPPILLEHGERYPREWRSVIWRWSKKPEMIRIE